MAEIDDQIGQQILGILNVVATSCNAAYDAVNTRAATVEEIRAHVTVMRRQLSGIELRLINNSTLRGAPPS